MRALAKIEEGPGNIGVIEVEDPRMDERDVLIQVEAAGICHTDFIMLEWSPTIKKLQHPPLPIVMGHEFSGRILKIGTRVEGLEVGDPVAVNPIMYCGQCCYCLKGRQEICINRPTLGFQMNGGFAERVSVRAENVYKIPNTVDLEIAALCEPFNTVIHAFERARPNYGDNILISGPGPIGMLGLLMGQFCGCGKIIMTGLDLDQKRLLVAGDLGAITINIGKENVKERVRDETGGDGVDMAFETSGSSKAIGDDLALLKKGGKLVLIGFAEELVNFLPVEFVLNEIEMIGIRAYNPKNWETCLSILSSGKIDFKPLITHRLPLDEGEKGFQLIQKREGLKILLKPGS